MAKEGLPKPLKNECEEEFVKRCMDDKAMRNTFPVTGIRKNKAKKIWKEDQEKGKE